jgi:hypothetical protein
MKYLDFLKETNEEVSERLELVRQRVQKSHPMPLLQEKPVIILQKWQSSWCSCIL